MADYTRSSKLNPLLAATIAAGFTGAVVGGTAATARVLIQAKKGNLQKDQAVKTVLSESAGTGLATASAAVVIGALGLGGSLLGLIGFTGVAVGTKYFYDDFIAKEAESQKKAGTKKKKPIAKVKKSSAKSSSKKEKKEEETSKEAKSKKS